MIIRPSLDHAARVSAALSRIIEKLVSDMDQESPPTLEDVRRIVRRRKSVGAPDAEFLHPQDDATPLAEIDRLIEEYGADVLASDFVVAKASEALSRVIQTLMDETDEPQAPTLGMVRAAMIDGLTARLIGEGAIDDEDDVALQSEIEALIERHGETSLAEHFLRFE